MRAINHHHLPLPLLPQRLLRPLNTRLIEICPCRPTPQNNKAIRISRRLRNSRQPLLRHTHEMMLRRRSPNRVNSHSQTSICAVLEAHGEGETGSELAVELRFCCASADGAEADQVGEELRADGIQHLGRDGHALVGEVAEEFAAYTQALVDLEGLVDVGIVDQAFPADGCSRLFEVCAHDDQQIVFELGGERDEAGAVFERSFRVVEGTWAADYEEAVVVLFEDFNRIFAAFEDGGDRVGRRWVFRGEQLGWYL